MRLHPARPRGILALATLAGLCIPLGSSHVHATCGSANCFLITGTQEGVASKVTVILDLSYRYVPQERKLRGSDGISEVLTPKIDFENEEIEDDHHREISTQNSLVQLDVSWAVSDRFAVSTSLPLINDRDHEHFDDVGTPDEFFTGQDGTAGFGEASINHRPGEKITWSLQLNGRRTAHDRYLGREVDSTGATYVNLTPGMRFESGKTAAFYAHVQAPVHQHVNDAQLAPRTGIMIGVSRTFP